MSLKNSILALIDLENASQALRQRIYGNLNTKHIDFTKIEALHLLEAYRENPDSAYNDIHIVAVLTNEESFLVTINGCDDPMTYAPNMSDVCKDSLRKSLSTYLEPVVEKYSSAWVINTITTK
ncbi:hypothetical protein D3C78_19920 [compost metagenome]